MSIQRGQKGQILNKRELPVVVVKCIICFGSNNFSPILRHFSFSVSGGARKVSYKSQAVRSIQVKTIKNHSLGLYIECPRPLNTGVR